MDRDTREVLLELFDSLSDEGKIAALEAAKRIKSGEPA